MVAEGWWPEDGATFATSLGPVRHERAYNGIFATPAQAHLDPEAVTRARYRFTRERLFAATGVPEVVHRVRAPGLVADHHLLPAGSYAITNGLGLQPQAGGTTADENERLEILLGSDRLGPWANGWLSWISGALHGHDGSHPFRPFDRAVLDEPVGDLAGCILWPFGDPSAGPGGAPVRTWAMVPILAEELAAFRAQPGTQTAWIEERSLRGDIAALRQRWDRVA